MTGKIDTFYQDICKTYFPRWKPWKCIHNPDWNSGYASTDKKTIFLGSTIDRISLNCFIIHEICHAVGNSGHGKSWQDRMMKAADTARKQKSIHLADEIAADVKLYHLEGVSVTGLNGKAELEDAFRDQYLDGNPFVVDVVITKYLGNNGIRPEWEEKEYNKWIERGRRIAKRVANEVDENRRGVVV